jgi:prolyl-tRNA synthetase
MSTLIPTLKEVPADAEVRSHRLMIRAGFMRKLTAGAYIYLPLGWRVLNKITHIVREEMDAAGAVEIFMPALQPAELWHESGRFETYGPDLIYFKDRHDKDNILGPTHEEIVTDIVRTYIRSYKQLPMNLYQIQTKFRDEIRPRFGVLRSREFQMKDAYSFDADVEGLNRSYQVMYDAYCRIFDRCGLHYVIVEAESGPIGGDVSHEFMVPADYGEAEIVRCDSCEYAANRERAEVAAPAGPSREEMKKVEEIDTPGVTTIQQLCDFLGTSPEQLVKTLVYIADGTPVFVCVRGDHEVNENKVKRALKAEIVELADDATIMSQTGAPVGFAGPVGIKGKIVADPYVMSMRNCYAGANKKDTHLGGVNPGRDFKPALVADVRLAGEGDGCPRCTGTLHLSRGVEVGHVFKLGTKYSDAMKAYFQDEKGENRPIIMGCYGIGINRIFASLLEISSDEAGCVFPFSVAPYHVIVVPVGAEEEVWKAAEEVYEELTGRNIEVLLDDRDASPGVKLKDADLIGVPLHIIIGKKFKSTGKVELKRRKTGEAELVERADLLSRVEELVNEGLAQTA